MLKRNLVVNVLTYSYLNCTFNNHLIVREAILLANEIFIKAYISTANL